ncbi:MAG: putative Ig domain-containing protein [Steroidobacteraceae bacterium]|nr:putative Ig domain-containing protein [Steroidobacteraceae bacterium]
MHHALASRAHLFFVVALLSLITAPFVHAAAPRIGGTPPSTATVGVYWVFQPTAYDRDHDRLRFSIRNKPAFATFSSTTGRLAGVPSAEDVGRYDNIIIAVTDGRSTVSLPAFSVTVKGNANQPPTISGTPATSVTVGSLYSFQPTARDPEGRTLRFSIENQPSWASFSSTTGRLYGTPSASHVGTYPNVRISVSDGVNRASLPAFTITVKSSGSGGTNSPPTITGTPATSVTVGQAYSFQPSAKDADNDPLTFSITNKPSWATFSTSTGRLAGTPTSTGTTSNIVIRVSDGKTTVALPAFSIVVNPASGGATLGAATVSWTPPTRNTDGSTLTNLAGYHIVYGRSPDALTQTITINNPGITSYVIENLASGTWYFAVTAFTNGGSESALSNIVSKSVQ